MQKCTSCDHSFSYTKMISAIRNVTCPSCKTSYKVEAKSTPLLFGMILIGLGLIYALKQVLPANLSWLSYVLVFIAIFLLAPFNQRLEKKA